MSGLLIKNCVIRGSVPGSVYIEGGKVESISESPTQAVPSGTELIDAAGGSILPGLIDTHCHPFEVGRMKRIVDLRGASNMLAVRMRLQPKIRRAKPGEWVAGRGWDHELFPDRRLPSRRDIDDFSPESPVIITRVCGHIALLNSKAIEILGIKDKRGAEYERDSAGEPTGIVKEGALEAVYSAIPDPPDASALDLLAAEVDAARLGLTALHCIVSPDNYAGELEALAALHSSGDLSLKYDLYVPPDAIDYLATRSLSARLKGGQVKIRGVKIYADGSLGARTAALREPYADDPSNSGLLRYTSEELAELVETVDKAGYQAIVHAIGDLAVEQAIEAISKVSGAGNPRRHRVEHASLLPKDLRSDMARHSIRATVQPLFITSDSWAAERLGDERVRDLYPLKSMLREGIMASGSSDAPVESLSPVLGMWAAMARGRFAPEEGLSLPEALSLYTSNAASNGFDPGGELKEGSQADLTLLDTSIQGIHHALLRKVGISATIVGGEVVHSVVQG